MLETEAVRRSVTAPVAAAGTHVRTGRVRGPIVEDILTHLALLLIAFIVLFPLLWVVSMALGVAGAFAGGLIGRALGFYRDGESAGFVMSLIGAIIVVAGYQAIARRRTRY